MQSLTAESYLELPEHFKNQSHKQSHKLNQVGKIRMFPSSSDSVYNSIAYDLKLNFWSWKQEQKNQSQGPELRIVIGN